jgi:protein ImuB
MPSRIACVLVPLFPLAARLRAEPELSGEAVAILAGNGNAARIVAASKTARKAGIRAGFSLPQARAILPRLIARGSDPLCERSAQEALLEAAETISPRIEDAGNGVAYLDANGMERCFSSERALGQSLAAAVEAAGLPSRVGIAGSKLAARVAADSPDSPFCVPPEDEAEFLSRLPLSRLILTPAHATPPAFTLRLEGCHNLWRGAGGEDKSRSEVFETLERWGLRTIGEFARLPEGEVVARLGEAGRRLHLTARGIDPSPLLPRTVPPSFAEGMDLEWPLVAVEPFLFVARAALERLSGRLCAQALACTSLSLELKLDPDGVDARAIELPAPTRDVKTLLTLVRLDLESKPPGAPVVGFRFDARPDRPRRSQLSLFGPAALSSAELATCIAKLAARLGADRVGQPAAVDGHRPERFALVPYDPPAPPDFRASPRSGRGLLAVRVLRPAAALEVDVQEGKPVQVTFLREPRALERGLGKSLSPGQTRKSIAAEQRFAERLGTSEASGELLREVRVASGPWRMEEEWWSENGADRDYWDVELSDGALYRIFQDRKSGAWFADGIYD